MKQYSVSEEFKITVIELLKTKKFNAVFQHINLLSRDGNIFREDELNSVIQLLGELPYMEVYTILNKAPEWIQELKSDNVE